MQRKIELQTPLSPTTSARWERLGRNPQPSCPCCHLPFSVDSPMLGMGGVQTDGNWLYGLAGLSSVSKVGVITPRHASTWRSVCGEREC
jgi:hypothetical protein